ncbi:MAG TPA: thiamine phosphate synthase [Acetobacteraceae bacterium]|nr:thiamine phosphate synthase [Acetobacteraceae bacterium]
MDRTLFAWARAVKARGRRDGRALPPLWLFTDPQRLPDARTAVAALPRGLCGVVLRPGATEPTPGAWRDLARLCRERRLALVVAGDPRLAATLGAGLHLRGGRRAGPARLRRGLLTSSAHGRAELVRARRAGADAAFLSPVFPTASHPGAASLGPVRWSALARRACLPVMALGGVAGRSIRALPRHAAGAGAIGALDGLRR